MIITLRTNINGGETILIYVMTINDMGKRAHVIKHSHGRFVVGASDKILRKVSIWTGHRVGISFILHK